MQELYATVICSEASALDWNGQTGKWHAYHDSRMEDYARKEIILQ